MKPAMKALFDYAAGERQSSFSTSWTTCGIVETTEETLITAALVEEYGKEAVDTGSVEWIEAVPLMLLCACVEELAATWGDDDAADAAIKRVGDFVGEMMYDLTSCHVRES